MNIVLTGFMCAGKTTIGRKLAKLLDYNFIDTDMEEEDQGCSVEDIFKYGGEECFQDIETKMLEKLKNVQIGDFNWWRTNFENIIKVYSSKLDKYI